MLHKPNLDRTRSILAERFGDLAVVLLLLSVITVVGGLLPFRLQDLGWLSDAIAALIATAPLALAALVLLHLGSYYNPDSTSLTFRRTLCTRLAIFVVFGYLLLIPLQLIVGIEEYQGAQLHQQRTAAAQAQLADIRRKVQAATSSRELQESIPVRGPLSAASINWSQPPGDLRQEILTRIVLAQVEGDRPAQQMETSTRTRAGRRGGRRRGRRRLPELTEANSAEVRLWTHAERSLLRGSQLLMCAAAFALMAQRPSSDLPILKEWIMGFGRARRGRKWTNGC